MKSTSPKQHIQRFYSPLVIIFGIAVIIITVLVVLLILQGATVVVTLKGSPEKYNFHYAAEDLDTDVVTADVTDTYSYSGFAAADDVKDAIATGNVTLTNNSSANQPLVKTTRLLSDSGVLFRINEDVVVPAGGTVDVDVYADEAGASGNIAPSHFEIVALNASLKPKIYADSTESMTGGIVGASPITEAMLNQAKSDASAVMIDKATEALETVIGDDTQLKPADVIITVTDQTTAPEVGAIAATINVITTATAETITVKAAKLRNTITEDTGIEVADDTINYTVQLSEAGTIEITGDVTLVGSSDNLSFIELDKLTNKTPTEVTSYISSFPLITDVKVSLFPFWLTTTPSDPAKITLQAITSTTE